MLYTSIVKTTTETIERTVRLNDQDVTVVYVETIETTEAGDDRTIEIETAHDLETGAEFDGDWDALEKVIKNS